MKVLFRGCLLLALCVLLVGGQTLAAEAERRAVSVRGTAERQITPDVAFINLGVSTQADRIETARTENAAKIAEIVKNLKKLGVEERNLKTANFDIRPVYVSGQERQVIGYAVDNVLTVRTTELGRVSLIIDTALAAGGNRLEGVRFSADKTADLRRQLLAEAVKDGQAKAAVTAAAAGCQLGVLLKADVFDVGEYQPRAMRTYDATGSPLQSQVFAGSIRIAVEVALVYELQ